MLLARGYEPTGDSDRERPPGRLARLIMLWRRWNRFNPGGWLKAQDVDRALDALSGLRRAAQDLLERPSTARAVTLRSEYDASQFHLRFIRDRHARTLALHATHECARALSPVAAESEDNVTFMAAEIDRAHNAAREALIDHLHVLVGDAWR